MKTDLSVVNITCLLHTWERESAGGDPHKKVYSKCVCMFMYVKERLTGRQTGRETGWKTDRQTGKHAGR